jgi:hypothetical protein
MCPTEVSTESSFDVTKQRGNGRRTDSMHRNLNWVDNKTEDRIPVSDFDVLTILIAPRNAHPFEASDNIHMIEKTPRHIPLKIAASFSPFLLLFV